MKARASGFSDADRSAGNHPPPEMVYA